MLTPPLTITLTIPLLSLSPSALLRYSVVLRVKEKAWWTASGHDTVKERTLAEYTLLGEFMPDLTAKNSKSEVRSIMNMDASRIHNLRFIQTNPIQNDAMDSYDGPTIKMEHYIDLEFHTGVLYTNMHLSCPITVYKNLQRNLPRILSLGPQEAQLAHIPIGVPAFPLASAPPPPPGWNPAVAPLRSATAPAELIKPVKQAPALGVPQVMQVSFHRDKSRAKSSD